MHIGGAAYAAPMTFGTRLREKRKAKGLTQAQLGEGLGTDGSNVGKAVVYGWEKDQHSPRADQLAQMVERLDCSADYLLRGWVAEADLSQDVASLARTIDGLEPKARAYLIRMCEDFIALQLPAPPPPSEDTAEIEQSKTKSA